MKKIMIVFFLMIAFALFGPANAEERSHETTFVLPSSLRIIDEEAFKDTAAEIIILPDGFQFIGENAFKGVYSITDVYIPRTTVYIAETSFDNGASYTIHGVQNSYAEDWAKQHDIPFEQSDIWFHQNQSAQDYSGRKTRLPFEAFEPQENLLKTQDDDRSYRPQDRPEFYPMASSAMRADM